tara:strand:- start:38 stop:379 length:342 start_codon:yes stop_codon:yes gene_type:complete
MKGSFILLLGSLILVSCNNNVYGTYNTNYSKDKSVFFEIKLKPNNTVEKTTVHTISDFAQGKYVIEKNKVICYLDSSRNKFTQDTIIFKIKGKKLYPIVKEIVNTKFYLKKNN